MQDIIKLIETAKHAQTFSPEDKLTELISSYDDGELDFSELELVSAAGGVSYQDFLKRAKSVERSN